MFGTDPSVVLSTYLFKVITKLARAGGSQNINNVQEHNFAKEIDDLGKVGEDMFASVSQREYPTHRKRSRCDSVVSASCGILD